MSRKAWIAGISLAALAAPVLAEESRLSTGLWPLFRQSFDLFTVLLLLGSLAAAAIVTHCLLEIRERVIAPARASEYLLDLARQGRIAELRETDEASMPGVIVRAAAGVKGAAARREAGEMAAAEECSRWFRKVEVLNVIGNLGPLVGLAGTVWGMVLAFSSLGAAGGQANPGELSVGIAKALFHTLLGLMLAIPCLLAYGLLKGKVDRLCTRAMAAAARVIDAMPEERQDSPSGARA